MTRQEQRAYWQERLADQAVSGLSGLAWCVQEGVSYPTFLRWRRRLVEEPATAPLTLVRVTAAATAPLVVTMGTARIEVTAEFDPLLLRRVVAALEA